MFYCVIMDRDGGDIHVDEEPYETYQEADAYGRTWEDDPRYGSHEVVDERDL